MWIDPDGKEQSEEYVFSKIKKTLLDEENLYEVVVACDSNQFKNKYKFVTAICLYKLGKGGEYYYTPSYEERTAYGGKNQKMRMFSEVAKSIELADKVLEMTGIRPVIHVDASPKSENEYTSSFSDQLKGYVISSGYDVRIKPDSWAASSVSDRHSK